MIQCWPTNGPVNLLETEPLFLPIFLSFTVCFGVVRVHEWAVISMPTMCWQVDSGIGTILLSLLKWYLIGTLPAVDQLNGNDMVQTWRKMKYYYIWH